MRPGGGRLDPDLPTRQALSHASDVEEGTPDTFYVMSTKWHQLRDRTPVFGNDKAFALLHPLQESRQMRLSLIRSNLGHYGLCQLGLTALV